MNKIDSLFQNHPHNNLILYFTAGFPSLNDTKRMIKELTDAGVNLIEIGMPYSDPLADGETIQQSSSKALENGMTLPLLFEQLETIREVTDVPLIMMGYLNQLLQYGLEKFCKQASECGIDGLIIPDMPLAIYEQEYKSKIEQFGLYVIFLVTPRTPEHRVKEIDALSRGFIYLVADSSITGNSSEISDKQIEYFKRIQAMQLNNPILIGFGISDKKSFDTVCQYGNGAIIGSAFIRHLEAGKQPANFVQSILN